MPLAYLLFMSDTVRVRFAPSPTGLLHIGGLRTALYNYLFARSHGGAFVLRIEDTDQERFVDEAEADLLESLRWAGLDFDEGPQKGGACAPYRQSERRDLYARHVQRLLDAGHAYYAFDTPTEIEAMRENLGTAGAAAAYDAVTRMGMTNSLTLTQEQVAARIKAGDSYVVRLKVMPGETVRFEDAVRGWVAFDTAQVDDQVLLKSDGMPTYHLANVVDDHAMGITHVIRGEEWLPSTPKHVLLYHFLGWEPPKMAHLPLILSPTGGKLSKRNAEKSGIPVSVRQYREAGYEPEALLNFLAFLGWNPGTDREVFTLDELVEAFTLERVGSSGVQFNLDKLRWYNATHLRRLTAPELALRVRPAVDAAGFEATEPYLIQVCTLLHDRLTMADEVVADHAYFFRDPETYEEAGVKKRWKDDSVLLVRDYAGAIEKLDGFDEAAAEQVLREITEAREAGAGRLIHPARLAVSGKSTGPGLFEMMALLGQEACVRRLRRAADTLG